MPMKNSIVLLGCAVGIVATASVFYHLGRRVADADNVHFKMSVISDSVADDGPIIGLCLSNDSGAPIEYDQCDGLWEFHFHVVDGNGNSVEVEPRWKAEYSDQGLQRAPFWITPGRTVIWTFHLGTYFRFRQGSTYPGVCMVSASTAVSMPRKPPFTVSTGENVIFLENSANIDPSRGSPMRAFPTILQP